MPLAVISIPCNLVRKDGVLLSRGKKCQRMDIAGENMGRNFVKGNEFIRSYYKCTHPSCQVKKQLECSHDGKLVDIVYIGEHEHPKPQLNLPQAVGCVLTPC
ncbi:hypothetical protein OIU77_024479 [Salix suchowensis]|uniref:WRKY domain-containing protein n=1 Tax=Salix suchowensis TaxID=1278906 RepID=A0ABQ9BSV3_9ROSI|nr:hypothetical protein OIU77_024479 [Salix suchowensis]